MAFKELGDRDRQTPAHRTSLFVSQLKHITSPSCLSPPLPVPPHSNVDISKYEEEKCLWQAVILLPELCQESVNIITFYPPI